MKRADFVNPFRRNTNSKDSDREGLAMFMNTLPRKNLDFFNLYRFDF